MTDVAVVVPYTTSCEYRERAWEWVRAKYAEHHPEWRIVEGRTAVEGFSRTQAIRDGVRKVDADIYIVADADVWCDGIAETIEPVDKHGWAIPHHFIHRLSKASTWAVFGGADWHGLPLSDDNPQDRKPYKGHEVDTLCVFRADVIRCVPPDPRFIGWGQEGDAWACALRTLVGPPWRGDADLVHLYHPPQPRRSRIIGNETSKALLARYRDARNKPQMMRALLERGERWHESSGATSVASAIS